jgi:hypothetical protein
MSTGVNPSFAFYYAKPGPGTVSVLVHLDVPAGAKPESGFDVSVNHACAVDEPFPSDVTLSFGTSQIVVSLSRFMLSQLNNDGTIWEHAFVTTPAAYLSLGTGSWGFVQEWTLNRTTTWKGDAYHDLNNGLTGLDNGYFPYQPPGIAGWRAADGTQTLGADSPGNGYDQFTTATAGNDSFDTYMIYLPPGGGSTYVPIYTWHWTWVGSASRLDASSPWTVTDGSSHGTRSLYPAHPVWIRALLPGGWAK